MIISYIIFMVSQKTSFLKIGSCEISELYRQLGKKLQFFEVPFKFSRMPRPQAVSPRETPCDSRMCRDTRVMVLLSMTDLAYRYTLIVQLPL